MTYLAPHRISRQNHQRTLANQTQDTTVTDLRITSLGCGIIQNATEAKTCEISTVTGGEKE